MKKSLLTGAALLGILSFAATAQAADIAPATYDWTGFYVGANAGVAWNNSDAEIKAYSGTTGAEFVDLRNKIDGSEAAFTAGGLLGYNYQIDQIVLGAETDFNYLGFSDSNTEHVNLFNNPAFPYTTNTSVEADWFGTIRARLGFAMDNFLIYGTGGAAYGHVSSSGKVTLDFVPDTFVKGSVDETKWGWTVGGGMEYGIDNWSLGLEYLYVDLGSDDWSETLNGDPLKGSVDYAFSTVRATVKYRFQ